MPYQVEQLLEGKEPLVHVSKDDAVKHALSLMIEYDYSQLPVIMKDHEYDIVEGMITYEGIIRGIRNFNLPIELLKVRNVMGKVFTCNGDDDLFDILDRLKETNSAVVMHKDFPVVEGIITSYDTTEYFRIRTEDLMRVEEVESTVRELIQEAYTTVKLFGQDDVLDQEKLDQASKAVSYGKPKDFEKLTLSEYINLLTNTDTWMFFEPVFNLPIDSVRSLLNGVRETRNSLAHFRGEVSAEERDRLKFAVDWISRCREEYQVIKDQKKKDLLFAYIKQNELEKEISNQQITETTSDTVTLVDEQAEYAVTDATRGGGRYAALADWLQSQPGRVDQAQLMFSEIENIIGSKLPESARAFRAWWANDTVSHSHSQLWLDAGWRTTYINLTEERVTFSRIREREKAYIGFFSRLIEEFRKGSQIPIRDQSPDGTSWLVLQTIPRGKPTVGQFVCSFTRDRRFRIELYLDLRDKELTKRVFDRLCEDRANFENQLGPIEWERLETRRASRIAIYRDGHITEEQKHDEMRRWAVETFNKFYVAFVEPAEKAIFEVWNG